MVGKMIKLQLNDKNIIQNIEIKFNKVLLLKGIDINSN